MNIYKELRKPNIDLKILSDIISNLDDYNIITNNQLKKSYYLYIYDYLFDNQYYDKAITIYNKLILLGVSSNIFYKFYYKINKDNKIDNKLKSVVICDGDDNVDFLKSLILFEEKLKINVKLYLLRIMI